MCILIVKPKGVEMPDYQTLRNCYENNPHGMGISIPGLTYKTLNFDEFVSVCEAVKENVPAIIHFRYATHGSICRENSHPFYDSETGVAFAHNGILPINPIGDMTDSETAFISLFVPAIKRGGLNGELLEKAVKRIIGHSKFAFMNRKGQIKTFGQFYEEGGIYYSNTSFMYSRKYLYRR